MTLRSVISGTGSALPKRCVTNAELAETVDTTDEWIVERTGIRSRYIADSTETTASLATDACRRALDAAGIAAADIGLIVLATATPDQTFPSSATKVQAALGIDDCIAFDVHAVCTGFLYALSVADSMLRSGAATSALVIGSETFSRILDWDDRGTCVLFGDGAGALVLKAEDGDRGILATRLHADGRHNELLYVDGGPSTTGTVGKLRMKGREVFRHAVKNLADVLKDGVSIGASSTVTFTNVTTNHLLRATFAVDRTVKRIEGRSRYDVAATLAEKGFEREPVTIIEVCNARYASQVLASDVRIGLMLPCPVMVYVKEDEVFISTMRPSLISGLFPDAGIEGVAMEVESSETD